MNTLFSLLRAGTVTQEALFPSLVPTHRGLPHLTDVACKTGCEACVATCPTDAIAVTDGDVRLDPGRCLACGLCTATCPTGALAADRRTTVASHTREGLVVSRETPPPAAPMPPPVWHRSFAYREVSTGDNATDMEVAAAGAAAISGVPFAGGAGCPVMTMGFSPPRAA